MSQAPAPRKVAEFVLCRCKKNCKTNNCPCRKSNLVCTEACLCDNCENWVGNCKSDSDSENDIYIGADIYVGAAALVSLSSKKSYRAKVYFWKALFYLQIALDICFC